MFKKYLSIVLVGLMFFGINSQIIQAQSARDNSVEKIKTDIRQREAKGTRVVVELKDGTKVKGYITQVVENSFDVTNYKTQQTTTVPYRDVLRVKKQGMSKGVKIAIGVGIAATVAVLVLTAPKNKSSGPFCIGCGPLF